MTDLTAGKVYDRVSMTWLEPAEYARRRAVYEEAVFQAGSNQGQLACPMLIRDGMDAVKSMTNGRIYDSKSSLRREYARAGVIEVGNDVPTRQPEKTRHEKDAAARKRRGAAARALSQMGYGAP